MRLPRAIHWGVLLLAFSTASRLIAEVAYRVTPSANRERLLFELTFDVSTASVDLQLPSWSPGIYSLQDSWKNLRNFSVTAEDGSHPEVAHNRGDTWSIASAGHTRLTVAYEMPVRAARFNADQTASDDRAIHYGTPAMYVYILGRKAERCTLEFAIPAQWKIAVGLSKAPSLNGNPTFQAGNYDELLDTPVTMGDFLSTQYTDFNRLHTLAVRGPAKDGLDLAKTVSIARFVTHIEDSFFRQAPYPKYVWHLWSYEATPLAGGTEHANGVEMHLAAEQGDDTIQGMAHEFFHLWNAKRLRPQSLGPFDYTQLPHTGALWFTEGVTDYYSVLLPYRYGAWSQQTMLSRASHQVELVRSNEARFQVSPFDASYQISPEFPNHYKVDYYSTGWVLGMLFDIELRDRTAGRYSLDDVVRALWRQCQRTGKGFREDDVRQQLIRFGGLSMGRLYDQWVLRPGDLPINEELGKAGLALDSTSSSIQTRPDITPMQRRLLDRWLRTTRSPYLPATAPRPQASVSDSSGDDGVTGRYEIANNVLFTITRDARGLSAGFEDSEHTFLWRRADGRFVYPRRNAVLTFHRDTQNEVTGILWDQQGRLRTIPRIGPFMHTLQPHIDPNPGLTTRVRQALQSLADGVRADMSSAGLASGTIADYAISGPVHGLAGLRSIEYIGSEDVDGRGIDRHRGVVSRISYYKLITEKRTRFLMVYLTRDGLVTDFDYVED